MTYLRAPSTDMERPLTEVGPVLAWDASDKGGAVIFLCPCGERENYVTSPPHGIEFDGAGKLTLNGSVGWRAGCYGKPQNWCHFRVNGGEAEMCDDALCPGNQPEGNRL